jgi:hypothetical protein
MKHFWLIPCFLFCWPLLGGGQTVKLTISTDATAALEMDGKTIGVARLGQPIPVETEAGEHQLIATPQGGGPQWRKLILVSPSLPSEISIPLQAHLLRFEVETQGFWKDQPTNLTWASSDNGSGVTVSQAGFYCRRFSTGGFHDWRLPSIDELQLLFGGPADDRGFRIVAPLKLSGWAWSATEGNEPAENWALDFGDGARASVAAGDAGLNRALCVRSEIR